MDLETYLWKNRITQKDFAKKSGVKRTTIGAYISKYRRPSGTAACKIYEATDGEVSYEELFFTADVKKKAAEKKEADIANIKLCI